MAKHGFMFAVIAALCWGIAPLFAKSGLFKIQPFIALSIRTFIVAIAVLILLIASGSMKELQYVGWKAILILGCEGLLASLIGHFLYFKAIKVWEVSRVTPIVASYPLIAFILAIIFFSEKVTLIKSLGAVLAVSGIVLLGL